ncbi:outer membrane protein assembly factor BamB family protein [Kribbella sp. NPDC055071]
MMKQRIVAVVAGVAVVAAAGVVIGRPAWAGRCSASFDEVPAADLAKLHAVPVGQVKADDFEQEYRENVRNLLAVAQHPVAPLGQARSAVVVPHQGGSAKASLINSNDGNVRLSVGGGGLIGTATSGAVVQVNGPTGQAAWGRRQVGYGAGGGDVADHMVLMHTPRNKAPRVTAVNTSNGDLDWCTKLGKDSSTEYRPTFDSAAAGDAIFVVRESDADNDSDDDVRLSRLDAGSGKVNWDKPLAGLRQADSLWVLHDQLLLSPFHTDLDNNGRRQILEPDQLTQPVNDRGAIVARSAADGGASWLYRGPDDRGWINNVVGTGKDVAVVISRRSSYQGKLMVNETWMTGIDRTGKRLWKHDFKDQFDWEIRDSFLVTGDLVLSYEKVGGKTPSALVARSLATGAELWRTQLITTGSPLRHNAAQVLGDSLLANSYDDGLTAVDLRTGAVTNPLPGRKIGPIDRIVSDGRTVTIDANGLFLTFDRTP